MQESSSSTLARAQDIIVRLTDSSIVTLWQQLGRTAKPVTGGFLVISRLPLQPASQLLKIYRHAFCHNFAQSSEADDEIWLYNKYVAV